MESVQTEDAAVFDLLRGEAISSKIKSYCVNMQLLPVGDNAGGMFARPINNPKTPETNGFLRDLKTVAAKKADLQGRAMEEESLRGAGFRVRQATFEECTNTPTVRLFRPMADRSISIAFATVITKCGAVTVGENFRLNRKFWERQHLAYYYPVAGPPGCSQNSKVVPGEPTDKFLILER